MAAPITEKFEQMTLEVSENGTTWAKLCGLVGVTISRSTTFDTQEVPADCDDESKPLRTERQPRTQEVTVSASGVWAQQSHKTISDWWSGATTKKVRIGHQAALTGDPQYETGDAYLTSLNHVREKGQKVNATLEIAFDGVPLRTNKA